LCAFNGDDTVVEQFRELLRVCQAFKKTKIGIATVKKILQLIILLVYDNQSTSCGSEMYNKRTSFKHDK
jgi:hypothetical protein